MNKIIKVGQVSNKGSQSGSAYSTVGLFPTVCACTHGYAMGNIMEIKSVDMSKSREGNKVYNNMRECVNMYKKELLKFKFNMEEVRIFDVFSGIGALHQAHKELGVPTKIIALSEIDIDAIISYASIHIDNFNEIEFDYPSEDEMRELLIDRGIGYSYEKNKSSIPRLKKDKLYKVYKASILLNNLGDISKIDYDDLPDFDMMNFSFACFLPGTLILTSKGYKNIEDITSEDYVLTHTNKYQKVVKPMINKANYIYRIKTMCAEDLMVTREHPFYVRKRYREWNNQKRSYDRKFKEPTWVKAKELNKDFYVGVAINQEEKLPTWEGIEVNLPYAKNGHKKRIDNLSKYFNNYDFWWIVGRYIGDGWVQNHIDYKGTNIYNLYICCAKEELREITDVLDRLNTLGNDFKYKYYNNRTVMDIRIANVEFAKFLQQFGKYAKGKELNNTILDLPKNLLKGFLDGYISADGCFTQNHFKTSSISRKLTYGIAQCEAKVYGRPYSIYKNKRKPQCIIEGRLVNQSETYEVKWKLSKKKQDKAFYEDGYIWCPINEVKKENYQGLVYNMEVENDNSYTANGIIVHNCQDISNAGKQKGMRNEDGTPTRSGLYVYGIKAIRSKKPKYIMIENVKGLIQKKFIDDFYSIINELEEIGYNCYYPTKEDNKGNKIPTCLNTKNFGVPQNRERIFVYAIRKDVDSKTFKFNYGFESDIRLKHILEDYIEDKYYLSDEIQKRFTPNGNLDINRNELNMVGSTAPKFRTIGQGDMVYAINGVISTLTATDYKQPKQIIDDKYYITEAHKKYLIKKRENWAGSKKSCINKEIASTITRREGSVGCDVSNYICRDLNENCNISNRDVADFRIRRLTPKECWRLQGFRDECFDKAKAMGISDSSLYKQAGNSITVDVIYWNLLNLYKDFLN